MFACTFFGHRECPFNLKPQLRDALKELIEQHGVSSFYVGSQGKFDKMVYSVLRELSTQYPQITYAVVLAYMPTVKQSDEYPQATDYSHTLYPEGIETVPKRFSIDWRNGWMLKQADYVVTCVTHSWGGAAKFAEKAQRLGKKVIALAEE